MRISDADSMKLFESRGYLTPISKLLMRLSVIFCDFIFILPIYLILQRIYPNKKENRKVKSIFFSDYFWFSSPHHVNIMNKIKKNALFFIILIQPALVIIDHGHFQYNNCSLGLISFAIFFSISNHFIMGR